MVPLELPDPVRNGQQLGARFEVLALQQDRHPGRVAPLRIGRDAVLGIVEAAGYSEVAPRPHQADPQRSVAGADVGVDQGAARGRDIPGMAQAAVEAHGQRPQRLFEGQSRGQAAGDAFPLQGEGTAALLRLLGRNVPAHDVDHSPQGVGAVQHGSRSPHHLDALGGHRFDRHRVVRRRRRQVAGALPVLEHEQAVAAQSAQHGTGRSRAHGALRHPGLIIHGLGNGAAQVLAELAAAENDFRLVKRGGRPLVLVLDNRLLHVHGFMADPEIDVGGVPRLDPHLETGAPVCEVQRLQDVHPRGQGGEEEVPSGVADAAAVDSLDDHVGPGHRLTRIGVDNVTGERPCCRGVQGRCRQKCGKGSRAVDQPLLAFLVVIVVVIVVGVGVLGARPAFFDVDLDILRDEIGVVVVVQLDNQGGLPFFEADDVEGPGAVFLVVLDFGDALVADLPVKGIAVVRVRDEPVAVLGEEAHGQQGCFQAVPDLDFPLYLAVLVADQLLAAAEDDQAERLGVLFLLMGVYGIVVVAAAGKQQ